ncbi:MAG: hypothetical protein QW507_00835 [Candidatus Nanoarchaeia archaeon]|nr:hypothetical protein [Candidatus Haiyanarchaeum thermophilum]MCW1303360.1 hypothetical protein [Candidatus Haiyanarchaeum thermophilum]MCW1303952.1 hypothetical protein [Candidatus Haiyanarchaeum thermophilum]MCW1306721.1 hypothetical protein [Candidatus Haiyanarchaeum thermophilum]MCW1307560.1 hypothetical protein [Candidatus Haiyanarchaeum thermophilum]
MRIEEVVNQVERIATFLDRMEAITSPQVSKKVVKRRAFNKLLSLPLEKWEEEDMNTRFLRYMKVVSQELWEGGRILHPFLKIGEKRVRFYEDGKVNALLVPEGYFYFSLDYPSGILLAKIIEQDEIDNDKCLIKLGEELVNTLSPAISGGYSYDSTTTYIFHRDIFGKKMIAYFLLACKKGKNVPFPPPLYNRYLFLKGAELLGMDKEKLVREKIKNLENEIECISESLSQLDLIHQSSHISLDENSPYVKTCEKIGRRLSHLWQDGELGEWIQEMGECLVDLQKGGTYDFILEKNSWEAMLHLYLADTLDLNDNSQPTWNTLFHSPILLNLLDQEEKNDIYLMKEVIEEWRDALFDSIFKVYLTLRDHGPIHAYRKLVDLREKQRGVLNEGVKMAFSRLEQIVSNTPPLDKWLTASQ